MNDNPERLRQFPQDRFLAPLHQIDLEEATAHLRAESRTSNRHHRQETLYRHGPVTVALFLFDAGAQLPPHVTKGVVTVHVLEGRLKMSAQGQEHALTAGQMLVLAPGVQHDVRAEEPTRMLLTVCLEVPPESKP